LIFRLRGRTQEQVMQELRKRRAGADEIVEDEVEEAEAIIPLEDCIPNYWGLGTPLEGFSISIHPPAIEMSLLKRLGPASFIPDPGIEGLLHDAYQIVGRKALQVAFQEQKEENDSP
jgi:uncharacterized Zn finger protein